MKMKYKNRTMTIEVENPDDRMSSELALRLRAAINTEIDEFLQEVRVAIRKSPEVRGKIVMSSRPITVEIEVPEVDAAST